MFVWTALFVVEVLPWLAVGAFVCLGLRLMLAWLRKLEG